MSELRFADMAYCSICDQYFPSEEAKVQHIRISPNHPRCDTCDKRFANKNGLRNHLVCSSRHHYCVVCERDFRTSAGLRVHMEYAAVHRDDTDDEDDPESDTESVGNTSDGWEDALGAIAFPNQSYASESASDLERDEYTPQTESDDEGLPLPSEDDGDDSWDELDEYNDSEPESDSGNEDIAENQPVGDRASIPLPQGSPPLANALASIQSTSSQSSCCFTCPLCLEPLKATSATRCGHIFCSRCIYTALRSKKQCPICRMPAFERHLRKIYLGASF